MTYPFGAVVGMDDMRLALLLNAVSPAVGGVLVRGEKGTAKSTTVRALAAVLPPVDVVAGCRFACDPAAPDPACPDGPHEVGAAGSTRPARLVELPVGASEDRVVGSLDLERALTEGVKAFEPGGKPVSSTANASGPTNSAAQTANRRRTSTCSQVEVVTNCCSC